ncbi:DUF433 domain-containing protein [Desulfococcaceae bacterium HSG8]|nr:DUF433 domain-containing protein [Desulfococcaceae bacterium HSG8]
MSKITDSQTTVVRTERGLSVFGTRITLYQVMDYLKSGWHPELIRQWLDLTEQQINDVLNYINTHQNDVEAEYRSVLQEAEDIRRYWEECNRERFEKIASSHPEDDPVWLKIQSKKAELAMA